MGLCQNDSIIARAALCLVTAAVLLSGCKGIPIQGEKEARRQIQTVESSFRPQDHKPAMPTLSTNSQLADFLLFAMLNQPRVESAYFDWIASVERITVERSRPDPRFTFESDISKMVQTVMPGLMMDFPGPGKLKARGEVASAQAQAQYFAYENAALQAAFSLKKAYYQLYFLSAKIRVNRETMSLLGDLALIARKQNEVGKVTLQDVLRAQIEQDRLRNELARIEDSRRPLLAQFKAALGLDAAAPDPPLPSQFETTPLEMNPERLLANALEHNPRLKAMEAEIRQADAALRLAAKSKIPDATAGLELDAKATPVMARPSFSVTLPIWRDKIAAEIAAAQASKRSSQARFNAEQISLAVDVAEKSYMFREATRNIAFYQQTLLPNARLSLEVARAGYLSGKIDFFNLISSWQSLLEFELANIEARTQRELALAELSLAVLGLPPSHAPFLPHEVAKPVSKQPTKNSHAK